MVTFGLVSQQDVTVGGIGLLPAGELVRVTEDQLNAFEAVHGYPLKEAQFPSGVQVTVLVEPHDDEEEPKDEEVS